MRAFELPSTEWYAAKLSNLRMDYRGFPELPAERMLATGYSLRLYRPGDEDAWVALLAASDLGTWDRARLDGLLAGELGPRPLEHVVFAEHFGQMVATAHLTVKEEAGNVCSELSWVAVHPAHRGRSLGYPICRAVMAHARSAGHRYIFLKTQDFRVAAIKTYLKLGFEPTMEDESHPQRWKELRDGPLMRQG